MDWTTYTLHLEELIVCATKLHARSYFADVYASGSFGVCSYWVSRELATFMHMADALWFHNASTFHLKPIMDYLGGKKFAWTTCCSDGILLQLQIQWAL